MEKHPVRRLKVEGWKSFRSLDLTFDNCTVLIGSNGAGKSNLLSVFDLFRAITERRLRMHSLAIGGANEILHYGPKHTRRLQLHFEFGGALHYDMGLIPIHEGMLGVEQNAYSLEDPALIPVTKLSPLDPAFSPLESVYVWDLDLFDRPRTYQFHDTSTHSRIRGFADLNQTQYLHEDGGNLAAILWRMRRSHLAHYEEIKRHTQAAIPGFSDFVLDPSREYPDQIRLEWLGSMADYPMSPHQLSDGSLRWIALCTLLVQPAAWAPGVILLDEPELGLHPHALERLAGLVHAAAMRTQIILATQSPYLLNFFDPEQVVTIDHDGRESVVTRHSMASLKDWLDDYSMAELWEKNVLGGISHA